MNRLFWKYYIVLVSSLVFLSCSEGNSIKRQISKMCEREILINTDDMVACHVLDSLSTNEKDSKLKMVLWADSTECSQCYIRNLDLWKGYANIEREIPKGIVFYFIFETAPEKMGKLFSLIQTTQLNHTIYVDTAQVFRRNNPNIPTDVLYHTFLLDSNNKVILVGNPTKNKSIRYLFNEILNENLNITVYNEDSF